MYRRRLMIFILLACVASLGFILFLALRPSQLLRIAAPSMPSNMQDLKNAAKNTALTTAASAVTTTTLLEKPRYTGQDDLGRNWLVTANTAGQEGSATSGTYVLNGVQATFSTPSQTTPFTLSAENGRYQQTSSTLQLTGTVSATGLGFNLTAPKVEADLTSRTIQASGGSKVTGNAGKWNVNITAPNLNADQNSNRLLLTGGVHATFMPTKAK